MEPLKNFGQIAERLSKNPLGIIALFLVLVYGMAGFVATSSVLESEQRLIIVLFLVGFPILVLGIFYSLVTKHHNKLYAPSDFVDEDNFIKSVGDLKSSLKQIREEIDNQPLYRYTQLSEGGKLIILTLLDEGDFDLHAFSEQYGFQYKKLIKQAIILEDYKWLNIGGDVGTLKITKKGMDEVATFEDLCYGRTNSLKRSKRIKRIDG